MYRELAAHFVVEARSYRGRFGPEDLQVRQSRIGSRATKLYGPRPKQLNNSPENVVGKCPIAGCIRGASAEAKRGGTNLEAPMTGTSFLIPMVVIAVAGLLDGCQGLPVTDSAGSSGGSTMRFAALGTADSLMNGGTKASSSFRFRPSTKSQGRENTVTARERGSAEAGATLNFR